MGNIDHHADQAVRESTAGKTDEEQEERLNPVYQRRTSSYVAPSTM